MQQALRISTFTQVGSFPPCAVSIPLFCLSSSDWTVELSCPLDECRLVTFGTILSFIISAGCLENPFNLSGFGPPYKHRPPQLITHIYLMNDGIHAINEINTKICIEALRNAIVLL